MAKYNDVVEIFSHLLLLLQCRWWCNLNTNHLAITCVWLLTPNLILIKIQIWEEVIEKWNIWFIIFNKDEKTKNNLSDYAKPKIIKNTLLSLCFLWYSVEKPIEDKSIVATPRTNLCVDCTFCQQNLKKTKWMWP